MQISLLNLIDDSKTYKVSLASFSDRGTLEFMTLFDEKLKHERNKAIALQDVQKLMIGGAFGSPYFWSPFILTSVRHKKAAFLKN